VLLSALKFAGQRGGSLKKSRFKTVHLLFRRILLIKRTALFLAGALLAGPMALTAQTTFPPDPSSNLPAPTQIPSQERTQAIGMVPLRVNPPLPPFSRIGLSGEISTLGGQAQVAVNINKVFNLRGVGNYFPYSTTFTVNGFNTTANIRLASAGVMLDSFPFHNGFRISSGALIYNINRATATVAVPSATSFKLNGDTYYSATASSLTGATPISGTATLGLHSIRPSYVVTGGWGNIIPRDSHHWSFPVEVGAAFIGTPALAVNLNGWVCLDQAQTACYNFATDPAAATARTDLQTQVTKWQNDMAQFKVYPIVSFGVAYNFKIR